MFLRIKEKMRKRKEAAGKVFALTKKCRITRLFQIKRSIIMRAPIMTMVWELSMPGLL